MFLLVTGLGCGVPSPTPAQPSPTPPLIADTPTAVPSTPNASTATATPWPSPTTGPSLPQVLIEGVAFTVELAVTPEKRARGLMGREELGSDQGMLFLYDTDVTPSFWMRGMLVPLDIVWIDADGVVAGIEREVPPLPVSTEPLLYFPPRPIRFVLEIQAGRGKTVGIHPGSDVTFVKIPHTEGNR